MAKNYGVAVAVVTALCLVGVAHCAERLIVEGPVYCDTCRVGFRTPLSYDLKGAKVKVVCRNRTADVITATVEGTTDESGWYRIPVEGDHADELCEVSLVDSGDSECSERVVGSIYDARVSLTDKNGVHQNSRFAGSLGYATKVSKATCYEVMAEMGVLPPDFYPN